MKKFGVLLILALLLGTSVSIIFADELASAQVNANCNGATVTWDSNGIGDAVTIEFEILNQVHYEPGLNTAGSIYRNFSPALSDGTILIVRINLLEVDKIGSVTIAESTFQIAVNCDTLVSDSGGIQNQLCDDGRVNLNLCEPLAIYPNYSDEGVAIAAYRINRGDDTGEFSFEITAAQMASLPNNIAEACVIVSSQDGFAVAYLLPTGEIQINAGPDEEGKFFVWRFVTFPSLPEIETFFGTDDRPLPILVSCL